MENLSEGMQVISDWAKTPARDSGLLFNPLSSTSSLCCELRGAHNPITKGEQGLTRLRKAAACRPGEHGMGGSHSREAGRGQRGWMVPCQEARCTLGKSHSDAETRTCLKSTKDKGSFHLTSR